jgi:hypothetical protein
MKGQNKSTLATQFLRQLKYTEHLKKSRDHMKNERRVHCGKEIERNTEPRGLDSVI